MKNDKYKNLKVFHFAHLIEKDLRDKKREGLIFGNFGAMNLGDEAILTGELQELKKIKNIKIQVVSRNPKEIKRLHNTDSIWMYNLFSITRKLIKSDFVIVGGGGIICKADRNLFGLIYQIYMLFLYLVLPKIFNKRIYVTGIGIYDNANTFVLALSTYLLKSVSLLTVRDFHSYNYLKSKSINTSLYKDNSYLMDLNSKSEILKDEFFAKNYNPGKKNVGLALLQPDNEKDEKHLISEIEKMVNNNHKSTNYWFYSCDFQDNIFNDKLFAQKIYTIIAKNGLKNSLVMVPTEFSPNKFFGSFKLMDYFITMRLHGAIFSYRNNIDFLGITYDKKCASFLESIGKKPINVADTTLS